MSWIEKEVLGYRICLFVGIAIIFDLVYCTGFCIIAIHLGVELSPVTKLSPTLTYDLLGMLILMAFIEEFLFRLPLAILIKRNWSAGTTLVVAGMLSALFGLAHGADHIFIQGMSGFIYSIVFLKCGGFQRKFFKAFLIVAATHFLFNASAVTLANLA